MQSFGGGVANECPRRRFAGTGITKDGPAASVLVDRPALRNLNCQKLYFCTVDLTHADAGRDTGLPLQLAERMPAGVLFGLDRIDLFVIVEPEVKPLYTPLFRR